MDERGETTTTIIPDSLKEILLHKINLQLFDIQNVVTLCYDENCSLHKYYNIATQEIKAYQDIYLIDHIWSFENPDTVREQLDQSKQLQNIMATILHLPIEQYEDSSRLIDDIWKDMWLYVSTYENSNGQTIYFVQDQVGCGFIPSYENKLENFNSYIHFPPSKYSIPFDSSIYHTPADGTYYTVVWPVRDIEVNEPLHSLSMNLGLLSRLALLKVVDCEPFISSEDFGTLFEDVTGNENEISDDDNHHNDNKQDEIMDDDDEIIDPHHLSFPPTCPVEEAKSAIHQLALLFQSANYTVQSITSILQLSGFDYCLPVWELSSNNYKNLMFSRLRSYLKDHEFNQLAKQTSVLIMLFCLGMPLSLMEVNECIESTLLTSLLKLGILFFQVKPTSLSLSNEDGSSTVTSLGGVITSIVQIIPSYHLNTQSTLYFMTDFSHHSSHSEPLHTSPLSYDTYFEPVMYIGPDSLALFQAISPATGEVPPNSQGLDVFCGGGIQGITTLKINLLSKMTFVEKNHRAVRFLRFNLLLNGINLERAHIIHDSVENFHTHFIQLPQFQIILANPPYIPTGGVSDKSSSSSSPSSSAAAGEGHGHGRGEGEGQGQGQYGLLGYGAGGSDGEQFISFVFTDLVRYLSPPSSPSMSSGVYLVGNLVNIQNYSEKLTSWIHSSSTNTEFRNQLSQFRFSFNGYISHDKPWKTQEYAQLILNRNSSSSGGNNEHHTGVGSTSVSDKVAQYASDLTLAGVESVCNGLIFLKLQHSIPTTEEEKEEEGELMIKEIKIEECSEQIWQLLNLSEIFKEKNMIMRNKLREYFI